MLSNLCHFCGFMRPGQGTIAESTTQPSIRPKYRPMDGPERWPTVSKNSKDAICCPPIPQWTLPLFHKYPKTQPRSFSSCSEKDQTKLHCLRKSSYPAIQLVKIGTFLNMFSIYYKMWENVERKITKKF